MPPATCYIADPGNRVVRRVSTTGTITTYQNGFFYPDDVEVVGGTVYVADNCVLFQFVGTTGTLFGSGSCGDRLRPTARPRRPRTSASSMASPPR